MIGCLWKSLREILLVLLPLKNNININTQQFNKKKEILGTKENELSRAERTI